MKLIKLTRGFSAKVDDEDYDELMKYKWHFKEDTRSYRRRKINPDLVPFGYAARSVRTYINKKFKISTVWMHVQIMKPEGRLEVDHNNLDKLDNQRNNLRICTKSQNLRNSGLTLGKKGSKYKGVYANNYRDKIEKPFMTKIVIDGKLTLLGTFENEEDAAKRYDEKVKELFGPFARLNLPEKTI